MGGIEGERERERERIAFAEKREVDGDRTIKEWDDRDFHF